MHCPSSVVRPALTFRVFDWKFFSETAEQNSTKLKRKQDLNVLYQVCVFGPVGKTRWPPWSLIDWYIFDFSSEIAEQNSTKLDRKQDLIVFYQVCVFPVDWKNKVAALASDWLRHFLLLLWNRWTVFNKTWQGARSFVSFEPIEKTIWPPWPLIGWDMLDLSERNSTKLDRNQDLDVLYQDCVFRADREKQDGRLGLWLAEIFSTSPLNPLNGIFQHSLPSLCFSGRSEKRDGRPVWSVNKVGTLYLGAQYVTLWVPC